MWQVVSNVYDDDVYHIVYRQYINRTTLTISGDRQCSIFPEISYIRGGFHNQRNAYRIQEDSLENEIPAFYSLRQELFVWALKIYFEGNCSAIVKIYGGMPIETKYGEYITEWYLLYKKNGDVSNNSELNLIKPPMNCERMLNSIRIHYDYRKITNLLLKPVIIVFGSRGPQFYPVNNIIKISGKTENVAIESGNEEKLDYFSILPNEIVTKIFGHFDLRTLARTAQVCYRFNDIITTTDDFYINLDFKPYWNLMSDDVLDRFMDKTKKLKKLNLCWFNETNHLINNWKLEEFLNGAKNTLTHLYIDWEYHTTHNESLINAIFACKEILELHLRNMNFKLSYGDEWVKPDDIQFKNLRKLDFSFSSINHTDLIKILSKNRKLEHLILDSSLVVLLLSANWNDHNRIFDNILQKLVDFDINLKTWSSWDISYTIHDLSLFEFHTNLEEFRLSSRSKIYFEDIIPTASTFNFLAKCSRLKRLSLANFRKIKDEHLITVIENGKKLEQVNISDLDLITANSIGGFLRLENLKLLNITNCTHKTISLSQIEEWRKEYPQVKLIR